MPDLTASLGTLPPALVAITTGAKAGQTHPGPRLVVDGLEMPLPPHAVLSFTPNPLTNRLTATIDIPVDTAEEHPVYTGPKPGDLVNFATAVTTMCDTFHEKIATMRRRNDLQPDEIVKMQLASYLDGMTEAMTRLHAVVSEHLQ